VHPVDEVPRVLEFDGEEEGGGRVHALDLAAAGVRAAVVNPLAPELEAGGVGRAVEEVEVVLADVVGRRVNGVTRARARDRRGGDGSSVRTASGFEAAPYVAGPFPSRSIASIQYSVAGPPSNDALNTSSKSFFVIATARNAPPLARACTVAERTPVSSTMRASMATTPESRGVAETRSIAGGLVSSARAADEAARTDEQAVTSSRRMAAP
jgi:hypothetical protein